MSSPTCQECGALIPEGAAWCPACSTGTLLPCPVCGEGVRESDELCAACETVFRQCSGLDCPACQTPLLKGACFCVGCGQKVDGSSPTAGTPLPRCPSCGEEQPSRRRYCVFCGVRIVGY